MRLTRNLLAAVLVGILLVGAILWGSFQLGMSWMAKNIPDSVAEVNVSSGSIAEGSTPTPTPTQNTGLAVVAQERNSAVATVTAQAALIAQQAAATPKVVVVTASPVPPTITPIPTATDFVQAGVEASERLLQEEQQAQGRSNNPVAEVDIPAPRTIGSLFAEAAQAGDGEDSAGTIANSADAGGHTPDSSLPGYQSKRVAHSHNDSYAPEEGVVRPGYGTSEIEIMTVVGYELRFQTAQGEVVMTGGCQQAIFPPNTYAWNAGGVDWNYTGWYWDQFQTEWINEMAVLSWELVQQQIDWEDCPNVTPEERMAHVVVVEQDGKYVKLTPWSEWRRASGVDHTIMYVPGDDVYGWSIGIGSEYNGVPGQDGQDNLCLGGGCYYPNARHIGWCGGCIINSTWEGEIPNDAVPVPQSKIDAVMATLPAEG